MSDRLAEIKSYREAMDGVTDDEADWLISELEQSRAEVERLNALPAFIRNSTPGGETYAQYNSWLHLALPANHLAVFCGNRFFFLGEYINLLLRPVG
ncbi:hypothetical protein LCGC14_2615680 [marine sediment metagenome]|uniref:Uncharacterized protein n=1 Tax=marine sediment metagenome TaxID=412755 RepID=A0A0F9AS55_9ZZZZ